jgi:hypothetical protein
MRRHTAHQPGRAESAALGFNKEDHVKPLLRTLTIAVAALSLLAVAASSAQAIEWKIEKNKLGANETITGDNIDPAVKKAVLFKFEVQAIALIIECGVASVSGEIIPTLKGTQKFKLTKCSPVALPECTVEEPIEFSVETELKEFSGTVYNVMKPQGGGKLLFKLTLKGAKCVLAGVHEVKGSTCAKTEIKGEEKESYPVAFTKAHQEACEAGGVESLVFGPGSETANFKGTIWSVLTGGNKGKKWGVG